MSYCALWLDHQHAVLYTFTASGINEEKITSEQGKDHHQRHPHDVKSSAHDQELNKFFHKINDKLHKVEELLLMGPGTAKSQFKHHCEEHGHKQIAKAIVGVETMDSHPSQAQLLEKAKTFFKSYHLWTKNY
jgi:stalled ribosome rescue protein Dom34